MERRPAARCFGLAPSTVLSWQRRLRDEGEDRLIAPREAFNRYPDFVRDIVHILKRVAHGAGARRVADLLAKASLHVSATTVRRKLDTRELIPPVPPTVLDDATQKVEGAAAARAVAARYPHHVWGIDFTTVAIAGGRWAGCLAKILPQSWPCCWWITVVVDYHSRAALAVVASKKAPTTKSVIDLLADMIRVYGAPRYVVTDSGAQFGQTYAAWCKAHGIRVRYGAIGRKGSIAIVERFIRSLKEEAFGRGRWTALGEAWMRDALGAYRLWYNVHRPHQGLDGRTPDEVCTGQARDARRFEPRRRRADPGGALRAPPGTALTAAVHAFRGRKHLPVVEIRTARNAA